MSERTDGPKGGWVSKSLSLSHSLSLSLSVAFSLCVFLSVYLSMYLSTFYLSVFLWLSVAVSVCLSVWLSGCLAVWLSGCLAGCLAVCLSVCLPLYLSLYLIFLSIYLSVYLSICLSICRSFYLSVCLSEREGPKVVQTCGVFTIFTLKFAWRHRSVLFFNISTSKRGPKPSVLNTFDFRMCFAPQRRALFQQLNFQKCSKESPPSCKFVYKPITLPNRGSEDYFQ